MFPGAAARAFSGEDGDRDWCNAEPLWEGRWLGAESAGGVVAAIAGEESHGKYLSECEIREQVCPSQNFALCINATWQLSSRAMDYQ